MDLRDVDEVRVGQLWVGPRSHVRNDVGVEVGEGHLDGDGEEEGHAGRQRGRAPPRVPCATDGERSHVAYVAVAGHTSFLRI